MPDDDRKSELIVDLARTRVDLTRHAHGMRHAMDFGARFRAHFQRNGMAWMAAAVLLGLLVTRIPGRKKTVVVTKPWRKAEPTAETQAVKAGLLITGLKLAFDVLRPVLMKYVTRRLMGYAGTRFGFRGQ